MNGETPSETATAVAASLAAAYAIDGELEGGMSRVLLATERALNRRVVIKVLRDHGHTINTQRFRQEIMLSAGLQHPHIVPVLTAGEVDGAPYFVMPFVDGESLRAHLKGGEPLSLSLSTRVLRDIASALHYAHTRGIVHRDLKPENVMLSGGSAVVLDFGVAKALAAGSTLDSAGSGRSDVLTGAGFVIGTPRYMAPEQAAGDPDLDHRADLYAFGLVAFEVLTGAPPFTGSPSEILRQHIAEPPPALPTTIPRSLAKLVERCLAKAPSDRPESAARIIDALDGAAAVGASAQVPKSRNHRRFRSLEFAQLVAIPAVYAIAAAAVLGILINLAAREQVREGVVAAAVIGSLVGLPIAIACGLLVRVVSRERSV